MLLDPVVSQFNMISLPNETMDKAKDNGCEVGVVASDMNSKFSLSHNKKFKARINHLENFKLVTSNSFDCLRVLEDEESDYDQNVASSSGFF